MTRLHQVLDRPKVPPHPEVDLIRFKEWQAGMRRRWVAAQRSEPYEHRPWDRGFDIYVKDAA